MSSGNIPSLSIPDSSNQPSTERNTEERVSDNTLLSPQAPSENPVFALANLPQFQQMRALVQSNPDLLPILIQQIGADNSELLTVGLFDLCSYFTYINLLLF